MTGSAQLGVNVGLLFLTFALERPPLPSCLIVMAPVSRRGQVFLTHSSPAYLLPERYFPGTQKCSSVSAGSSCTAVRGGLERP